MRRKKEMAEELEYKLLRSVFREFGQDGEIEYCKRSVDNGLDAFEDKIIRKYLDGSFELLDVGCGGGREAVALANEGYRVTAVDLHPKMVEKAAQTAIGKANNLRFAAMNACYLGFNDEVFDGVLMLREVLAYVPMRKNRLLALRECFRILKPCGILIFTVLSKNCKLILQRWFGFSRQS